MTLTLIELMILIGSVVILIGLGVIYARERDKQISTSNQRKPKIKPRGRFTDAFDLDRGCDD